MPPSEYYFRLQQVVFLPGRPRKPLEENKGPADRRIFRSRGRAAIGTAAEGTGYSYRVVESTVGFALDTLVSWIPLPSIHTGESTHSPRDSVVLVLPPHKQSEPRWEISPPAGSTGGDGIRDIASHWPRSRINKTAPRIQQSQRRGLASASVLTTHSDCRGRSHGQFCKSLLIDGGSAPAAVRSTAERPLAPRRVMHAIPVWLKRRASGGKLPAG